jgi:putative SOS response-associated peptidase YedK
LAYDRHKRPIASHFHSGSLEFSYLGKDLATASPAEEDWSPRYNIAPTQPVPIIRQHPKEPRRELSQVRWGLIPSWAKDASGAAGMINARSESATSKPAFRDSLKSRGCLIPADGFYEWARTRAVKQPYCFESTIVSCSHSLDYGSVGKTQRKLD